MLVCINIYAPVEYTIIGVGQAAGPMTKKRSPFDVVVVCMAREKKRIYRSQKIYKKLGSQLNAFICKKKTLRAQTIMFWF